MSMVRIWQKNFASIYVNLTHFLVPVSTKFCRSKIPNQWVKKHAFAFEEFFSHVVSISNIEDVKLWIRIAVRKGKLPGWCYCKARHYAALYILIGPENTVFRGVGQLPCRNRKGNECLPPFPRPLNVWTGKPTV